LVHAPELARLPIGGYQPASKPWWMRHQLLQRIGMLAVL
jgi:hypothetical protein